MIFKNFCPFKVGDIYLTTNSTNPSSIFLGTTWQKIEGRFLLGTSGSGASKATGGSNSKTIAQANLPNVKLTVDSFTASISPHYHGTGNGMLNNHGIHGDYSTTSKPLGYYATEGKTTYEFKTSTNGGGTTGSVSPQTSALGSGSALDITPCYYTCHMWLRLT